jgi:hypothetical protein
LPNGLVGVRSCQFGRSSAPERPRRLQWSSACRLPYNFNDLKEKRLRN